MPDDPSTRLALASRGDALTPYLFQALERRYPISGRIDPELTQLQRYLVAAGTFRPDRAAWVERFHKSALAYRLRSGNARRQIARLPAPFDVVVQVHALFDVPSAPSALYIDCTHRQAAEHWSAWNPLSGSELRAWYRRERDEYRRAVHLFAFSEQTRRSLIDDYGVAADRVTRVGAGINAHTLPDPVDLPISAEPTVLFIGNDFVRKGGEVLLAAFAQVRREIPGARLVLVGTDPAITPGPGVQVLGRVRDRERIAQLYRAADVFVLPSYFDPFPLVLMEAMAFGLPVVASRSCGIPEIVTDSVTGALVRAGDVGDLAGALAALLRDPSRARAMGRAGRQRVLGSMRWDDVVARMAPALDAVASGRPRELATVR